MAGLSEEECQAAELLAELDDDFEPEDDEDEDELEEPDEESLEAEDVEEPEEDEDAGFDAGLLLDEEPRLSLR